MAILMNGRYIVVVENKRKAEDVITSFFEAINQRGFVTCAELNGLLDVDNSTRVDDKFGWQNRDNFHIIDRPHADGIQIEFPMPESLINEETINAQEDHHL